jgi:hypothetical protein
MKAVIDLARFFASHPLTHTSPIKAWQRWLSWQIKSRLRDEVIVPWIGGQLLAVRRGMTVQQETFMRDYTSSRI